MESRQVVKKKPHLADKRRLAAGPKAPRKARAMLPLAASQAVRQAGGPGLAEQARARLEEMVVTLDLPPGSVWSELQLSEMLGIGRTPVDYRDFGGRGHVPETPQAGLVPVAA